LHTELLQCVRLAACGGSGNSSGGKIAVYSHKALSREHRPEFEHCVALLDDATVQLRRSQPHVFKGKQYGSSRAYDKSPSCTPGVTSLSWSHDGSMLICGTYNGFVVLDAAGEVLLLEMHRHMWSHQH
jgi:hypothetical protein